jgi:hypothetical protein
MMVREAWRESANIRAFTLWLDVQIRLAMNPRLSEADATEIIKGRNP